MQGVKGPIGSMTQKMASFCIYSLPCTNGLQLQWLSFLASVDNYILRSERIAEFVFPPSARLFDKINELAIATLILPRKFEDALDKFPMIMQQVPFLDWALVHMIAWLNFLISALSYWGSKTTREKEITVVMSCNDNDNDLKDDSNNNAEPESTDKACCPADQTPPTHAPSEDVCPTKMANSAPEPTSYTSLVVPILALQSTETDEKSFLISSPESSTSGSTVTDNTDSSFMNDSTDTSFMNDSSPPSMTDSIGSGKCSYKEILTKGVKEDAEMEDNKSAAEPPQVLQNISKEIAKIPMEEDGEIKKQSILDEPVKPMVFEAKGGEIPRGKNVKKKKKGKGEKDQILRLFDASWSLS